MALIWRAPFSPRGDAPPLNRAAGLRLWFLRGCTLRKHDDYELDSDDWDVAGADAALDLAQLDAVIRYAMHRVAQRDALGLSEGAEILTENISA